MSLVEQAIARMRSQANQANQANAAAKAVDKIAELPAKPSLSAPASDLGAEAPKSGKRIRIDSARLREAGFLPEEGKERQFADNYRRIKRPLVEKALSGTAATGEARVIMITSALPGDGKTFTSLNLAMNMGLERDVSVLLVDCDVAKRHITDIVGLRGETGLLDALVDETLEIESLVVQTNLRGLSVLPAGRQAESTAELLSSRRMRQIISSLCSRNSQRIVLLDSPPLLITNEGRALVKLAGQVVLVVRSGQSPRHAVKDAIGLFDAKQAGGLILNHVAMSEDEGYYGFGSYGSYGVDGDEV